MVMKHLEKYYFSVEGETEKWYLNWLQKSINSDKKIISNVTFNVKVEKNPLKRSREISELGEIDILHVFDFEELSNEKNFKNILDIMAKASKSKQIQYKLGYSNYTFDLWIILHKQCLMVPLNHRKEYLKYINKLYGFNYESMAKYKEEKNFQQILAQLTLEDVKIAVKNADRLMKNNKQNYTLQKYKKYEYYRENPSLNLHEYIKKIFDDVHIDL